MDIIFKALLMPLLITSLAFPRFAMTSQSTIHQDALCNAKSYSNLAQKHCVPCEGGVPKLDKSQALNLLQNLHQDWKLIDNDNKVTLASSYYLNKIVDKSKLGDERLYVWHFIFQ
jgi:hypothetical protein